MGKTAVVLVDHGSRHEAANRTLERIADGLRQNGPYAIVKPAHMTLAEPTIAEAIDACVNEGADTIIVHPFFLSPGQHSISDIPRMVAEAAARYPGVSCSVTKPLGVHPLMSQIILELIQETQQAVR